MADKQTFSTPGVLDFDQESISNGSGKYLGGATEIAYLCLSGGGPGNVTVYDCASVATANYNNQKMTLDCSASTNDNRIFANPVAFKRGVVVKLNQGAGLAVVLSYGSIK